MPLRHAVALVAIASLGVMAGCDDGPPDASGGDPSASTSATRASDLAYPTYVALGDSYTAAPGVPQTEQATGCLRSNGNYASLVAGQLGSELVDVSCSGASTVSLVGAQQTGDQVAPPQFAALSEDTSLVTLGIGGNDLDLFQTMVATCGQLGLDDADGSPCRDYMADAGKKKDLLVETIAKVGDRVAAALQGIRDRAPQARVILVGYPQPVPAEGTCPILPLAEGDYPYVRGLVVELNEALRAAAETAEADFIDVVKASTGHDICAGQDAWVNGLNTDATRALAFHPFAEEQQAVADLIMDELDE
jgi:lysophospholipase L1-like esterase